MNLNICRGLALKIIKNMKTKDEIVIDGMRYGERELAQLIRRKMMTQDVRNKKKYTRKEKHRKTLI